MENATPIYLDLGRVLIVLLAVCVVMGSLWLYERE